jgi:hypothetical protein
LERGESGQSSIRWSVERASERERERARATGERALNDEFKGEDIILTAFLALKALLPPPFHCVTTKPLSHLLNKNKLSKLSLPQKMVDFGSPVSGISLSLSLSLCLSLHTHTHTCRRTKHIHIHKN